MWGPGNNPGGVLGGEERHPLLQSKPALERCRLQARPGADLSKSRPSRKIGIRLRIIDLFDRPAYANLAGKRLPVKGQCGVGIRCEFPSLLTARVGVKN